MLHGVQFINQNNGYRFFLFQGVSSRAIKYVRKVGTKVGAKVGTEVGALVRIPLLRM